MDAFQVRYVEPNPEKLSVGEASLGGAGIEIVEAVVKFQIAENAPVPAVFLPFTRQ